MFSSLSSFLVSIKNLFLTKILLIIVYQNPLFFKSFARESRQILRKKSAARTVGWINCAGDPHTRVSTGSAAQSPRVACKGGGCLIGFASGLQSPRLDYIYWENVYLHVNCSKLTPFSCISLRFAHVSRQFCMEWMRLIKFTFFWRLKFQHLWCMDF